MMNISSINYQQKSNFQNKTQPKLAFGRAFTTKEMDLYQQKLDEARNLYEITGDNNEPEKKLNNTTLILPDFYAPKGTIASDESMKLVKLMQKLNGINVVQGLPRGPVTKDNLSPFSSSPFEIGEHLIDLKKVGAPDLKTAYKNFKALPENNPLKESFNSFNEENPHLERYGMLEALKEEYGTDYWPNWKGKNAELDQNLFNYDETKEIPADKKARQEEIKENYSDTIAFYQYKQFIANKQHLETKENLNNEGIKFFGDCLIGFSPRDQWAFKPAFEIGKSTGCPGDGGKFNDWGLPCLDFNKLYNQDGSLGAAGTVLKKKFDVFLSNYDGARIDAGWQLSNPHTNKGSEYQGTKMIDIMEMAINDQIKNGHDIKKEDINIEALGGPDQAVNLTKNKYPHIQITRYAGDGWGRTEFYKQSMGYKLNGFTIGVGCHDDLSLIQLEKEKRNEQAGLLARDLSTSVDNAEEFRNAKFAELYTARNQFFTAPDAIGDERRLNDPADQKAPNWTIQAPVNYEEAYFKNLSEGKGLNTPKSLAVAIRAKMGENEQTREILGFLDKAGRILRQPGSNSINESDKLSKSNPKALGERLQA